MPHPILTSPEFKQFKALDAALALRLWQAEALSHWLAGSVNLMYFEIYKLNSVSPLNQVAVDAVVHAMELPPDLRQAVQPARPTTPARGHWYWPSHGYDDRLEQARVTPHNLRVHFYTQRRNIEMEIQAPPLDETRQQAIIAWLTDRNVLLKVLEGGPALARHMAEHGLIPPWRQWLVFANIKQPGLAALGVGVRFVARLLAFNPALVLLWRGFNAEQALRAMLQRELDAFEAARSAALARLPADPQAFWTVPALGEPTAEPLSAGDPLRVMRALPRPTFWPTAEENDLFMAACEKTYKAVTRKIGKLRPAQPLD